MCIYLFFRVFTYRNRHLEKAMGKQSGKTEVSKPTTPAQGNPIDHHTTLAATYTPTRNGLAW